jgi:pyruvate/2-oxoglutarate dehydrogenase complex dihydrolipoamide dehydrogenase (E3) component
MRPSSPSRRLRRSCNKYENHTEEIHVSTEQFEVLILGSGQGGKLLAWHMARLGRRTGVVERRWIGGSCPNVACLPSKNEIWSARVAHLVRHAAQFGTATGPVATDMAKVRRRKRDMVNREIDFHLQQYQTTGAEDHGDWAFCGTENARGAPE